MDMHHHIWKLINDDKLHFAPLRDPKRILDVGTGSGIWPIEMGALGFISRIYSFNNFKVLTESSKRISRRYHNRHRSLPRTTNRSPVERSFPG